MWRAGEYLNLEVLAVTRLLDDCTVVQLSSEVFLKECIDRVFYMEGQVIRDMRH